MYLYAFNVIYKYFLQILQVKSMYYYLSDGIPVLLSDIRNGLTG